MILGITFGFCAALGFSISYLLSRMFVARFGGKYLALLAISHVIMGGFALMLMPFLWPQAMPPLKDYFLSLNGAAFFYFFAQGFLFMALKKTDPSRVSPLLGLKVFILALISVVFLHESFSALQWGAVFMSICAAVMLSRSGGRIARESIIWIVLTCVGYSLSDLNIKLLVGHFMEMGLVQGSMLSACICYVLCGLAGAVLLVFLPKPEKGMWKGALPFSVVWFVAMLLLFGCIADIGVVFGNIIQATRGIISVVLGFFIAAAGLIHLEGKITKNVLLWRVCSAVLMVCAIACFYLGAG